MTAARTSVQGRKAPRPNWAATFQAVSRGQAPTASFGEILGKHTIDELKDLINAKDDEFSNLDQVSATHLPSWNAASPAAAQAWKSDYAKLKSDYAAARAAAQEAIAKAGGKGALFQLTPDAINTTADVPYKLILSAINPRYNLHDASTDRLMQLRGRLAAAGAMMTQYAVRQPIYTQELGTMFTRATDPITQGIEAAAHAARKPIGDAFDFAKYTIWFVIGGVVVLGFALIKAAAPAAGSIARAYLPPTPHQ